MFEDLILQLDDMGISYSEDYDLGTLTIDIADVEKSVLVDVIIALNNGGYMFNITETSITVEGGGTAPEEDTYSEDAYLDDALAQM